MKKIFICLFAAFICLGIVAQQADTKSLKKKIQDKKGSKQDKPADTQESKQDQPADKDSKKGKYNIGDKGPGGGIVFHVQGNTYFEVSPMLDDYIWDEAVKVARNYKGGGFTNWQLPTKEQLNYVYVNLQKKGIVNLDVGTLHWSSSEYSGCACAWAQDFYTGRQENYHKEGQAFSVRAVRSFTP